MTPYIPYPTTVRPLKLVKNRSGEERVAAPAAKKEAACPLRPTLRLVLMSKPVLQ
ncbi:hypothetical protein OIU79_022662 [Salix purpurea]|uniref:Uncharacterized protein n=1 Tax=Salix purpurea TaxID=77065 RepID=A0A9Q0WGA3_SALPP|nr:hypothetical protein OIU79_022662 [Salix purpurea]